MENKAEAAAAEAAAEKEEPTHGVRGFMIKKKEQCSLNGSARTGGACLSRRVGYEVRIEHVTYTMKLKE